MSIQFDTTPVRRQRRGPEPAVLLLGAMVGFLGLGLLKPWESRAVSVASTAAPGVSPSVSSTSAAPGATPVAAGPVAPSPAIQTGIAFAPAPGDPALQSPPPAAPLRVAVLASFEARDGYGITIVTEAGSSGGSADQGAGSPPAAPGHRIAWTGLPASGSALIAPTLGQRVLALGVTAPALHGPIDVRFWRIARGREPQRLTTPVAPGSLDANRLFLPPLEDGATGRWRPGAYRVEVLDGTGIVQFAFVLPLADALRDMPRPPATSVPLEFAPATGQIAEILAGRAWGPFTITTAGDAVAWPADGGPPLDGAGAWLGSGAIASGPVLTVSGSFAPVGTAVAHAWGAAPAVIGVSLPPGAHQVTATLIRLAPRDGAVATRAFFGPIDPGGTVITWPVVQFSQQRAFAAFAPASGTTWIAGVYRIDARYVDGAGVPQRTSWHMDIAGFAAPRGQIQVPALLGAAQRWSDVTPGWGVLSLPPLAPAGARATYDALVPAAPMIRTAPGGGRRPDSELLNCSTAGLIDIRRPVFGLNLPAGVAPDAVRLVRAFSGMRGVLVPALIVRSGRPNVWLIAAPPSGPADLWVSGRYQLEVEQGGRVALLQLCIGLRGASAPELAMPASTVSDAEYRAAIRQPGARAWPLVRPGFSPTILGS